MGQDSVTDDASSRFEVIQVLGFNSSDITSEYRQHRGLVSVKTESLMTWHT